MAKLLKTLRLAVVLVLMIFLSQCQMLGFLNFSSILLGGNFIASATADPISEVESDLLAEGPIDLPVTIAKLESPDASKLTITEINGGANLVKEQPLYQGVSRVLRISGLPDAVRDVDEAPVVVGFPYDQVNDILGDQIEVNVEDDGSFSIDVSTGNDALIASGNGADFISPFLQITEDPVTGYFVIITTNAPAGVVDSSTQMAVDLDGYYYLNTVNADGSKTLIRRNVDGSLVQEIVSNSTNDIEGLVVRSSFKAAYTFEKSASVGSLTLQLTSIVSSSENSPQLVAGADPLNAEEVVAFDYELIEISNYDYSDDKIKFYITDDEDGVVLLDRNDPHVQYINTTSTASVDVIRQDVYDDIWMALDIEGNAMYAWYLNEGLYSLGKANLNTDPAFAWGQRETILEFQNFDDVVSIAAENGTLAYVLQENADNQAYVYTEAGGVVEINDTDSDTDTYSNLRVSHDGQVVFACRTSATRNQLVYHRLGTSGFSDITTDTTYQVCDGSLGSYLVGDTFVHFYRTDSTLIQHAMVNIDQLD